MVLNLKPATALAVLLAVDLPSLTESIADIEHKHLRTRLSPRPRLPRLLSSEELLYFNDFENPNSPGLDYNDGCGGVYDSRYRPLKRLYDTPGFEFNNRVFSTDQGALSVQNNVYTNPQKIGGKYAVAISGFGDILLAFDAEGFDFVNVGMYISPIDMKDDGRCQGQLLPNNDSGAIPKLQINLYNGKASPGSEGYFNYMMLDSKHIEGIPSDDSFTFSWTYASVSLDASSATNGFVTLRFKGKAALFHYDAIDNLKIVGSDEPTVLKAPSTDSPNTGGTGNGDCTRPYEPSCDDIQGMPNRHICTFCSPDCPGEYIYNGNAMTWREHYYEAQVRGSSLVEVTDRHKNRCIKALMRRYNDGHASGTYLGGKGRNGSYHWRHAGRIPLIGESGYQNWAQSPQQPDCYYDNCFPVDISQCLWVWWEGKWDDTVCSDEHYGIYVRSPPMPTDPVKQPTDEWWLPPPIDDQSPPSNGQDQPKPKPQTTISFTELKNTACGYDGTAKEDREYGRWEGISRSACEEKCLKKIENGKNCVGFDYNEEKERCRVFYVYPFHQKSHDEVDCWLTD